MTDGNGDRGAFSAVGRSGFLALTNPAFIIRTLKDGHEVYYASAAVLEYDPRQTRGDPREEEGVEKIACLFKTALVTLEAVQVDSSKIDMCQATHGNGQGGGHNQPTPPPE